MVVKKQETTIELPKLDIRTVEIPLIGDSPLICHAWSEKARKMMADKQQKKASAGKAAKDPWADFVGALYWLSDHSNPATPEEVEAGVFGFPAIGVKAAAVDACTSIALRMGRRGRGERASTNPSGRIDPLSYSRHLGLQSRSPNDTRIRR